MTELEEIKLGYNGSVGPRNTVRVDTNCGAVNVTIVGDQANTRLFPLVTFHDFGFDHVSQFKALETCGEESGKFFSQFITYHIDMPGCEEGAADITTAQYPSLDDLAGMLVHVRSALNISKGMILLGVGAGANIVMRYMMNHYRSVLGAVLIEATNDSETWVKWTQDKITDLVMKPADMVSIRSQTSLQIATNLLDKHFGRSSCPTPILSDCRQFLTQRLMNNLNLKNQEMYYNSFYQRKAIPDSAFTAETVPPCLVISARQSWRNDNSVELRASLQKSGKEVILLEPSPCFLLPLEESPKKAALSMMLFVQGVGIGLSAGLPSSESIGEVYKKGHDGAVIKHPDPLEV